MTHCEYSSPGSSARDYRRLTPLVLMRALDEAGTQVCEPFVEARVETPSVSAAAVLSALSRLHAAAPRVAQEGALTTVVSRLPASEVSALQRQLPGLTAGEGLIEAEFAGYERVAGATPQRKRRALNALKRDEYLMQLAGRVRGGA
jgi:ribosomal protection tetracycline resistance protein